jgi:hypothetical protein
MFILPIALHVHVYLHRPPLQEPYSSLVFHKNVNVAPGSRTFH